MRNTFTEQKFSLLIWAREGRVNCLEVWLMFPLSWEDLPCTVRRWGWKKELCLGLGGACSLTSNCKLYILKSLILIAGRGFLNQIGSASAFLAVLHWAFYRHELMNYDRPRIYSLGVRTCYSCCDRYELYKTPAEPILIIIELIQRANLIQCLMLAMQCERQWPRHWGPKLKRKGGR